MKWLFPLAQMLRSRAGVILLSGIILSVIASAASLQALKARIMQAQIDSVSDVAEFKHRTVERILEERLGDATVIAGLPLLTNIIQSPVGSRQRSVLLEELKLVAPLIGSAYGYLNLSIFDLATQTQIDLLGAVDRGHFFGNLEALKTDERPVLIDFHLSRQGALVYGVVVPITSFRNGSSITIGAVYLEADASRSILNEIEQWPSAGRTAEAYLVRVESGVATYVSKLRFQPESNPLTFKRPVSDEPFNPEESSRNASAAKGGLDYRGTPVFASHKRIAAMPWFIVTKIDQEEALYPYRQLQLSVAVIGLFLMIFFAALAHQAVRLQREKVRRLDIEMNARFATALSAIGDATAFISENGRVLEWNGVAASLFGQSLHNKPIDELLRANIFTNFVSTVDRPSVMRQQVTLHKINGPPVELDVAIADIRSDQPKRYIVSARDISDALTAGRKYERLNKLYAFLNATNQALRHLKTVDEILDATCKIAVEKGNFALGWAAVPDADRGRAHPVSAHGPASEYARKIVVTLDRSESTGLGPAGVALREGRGVVIQDFISDPQTAPWHDVAREFGLRSCVSVPVIVEGRAEAALIFYSSAINYFDDDLVGLLDQVSRTVSIACAAALMARRALKAESNAHLHSRRYEEVFNFSPVALMVCDDVGGRLRFNKAHEKLFGYTRGEMETLSAWFATMYPSEDHRRQMQVLWKHDIAQARATGMPVISPLLELARKDGAIRAVQGRVSAMTGGVIVAWTDLTEREEQSRVLRNSEFRFRGLIEQSIVGIYVIRGKRALYANPKFLEICGRTEAEVLGHDPSVFLAPESFDDFETLRQEIIRGERVVADLNLVVARPDGERRDVAVHSVQSSWDGMPASIAIIQDISERKRAEEKIAAYLRQLTESMEGTLTAVSKMLDFRDPYTAGHERRVGIIAADLGKEMGLDEERCRWLRWSGLVHDIGKIAVPAEILSKPTRLSQLELELVKAHARAGYEILKDIHFPAPVAEIAHQHHERLDGSGYPQGLKGDEILIEARIVAVADVLESMATHRPYRPARGLDAALSEIYSRRGTFYDPAVVEALERLIGRGDWSIPQ